MNENTKSPRHRVMRVASAAAVASMLALGVVLSASTSTAGPTYQAGQAQSVTIPAGGTATITARGFCLQFGLPFPNQQAMSPVGISQESVRAALNYSIQRGYTTGNPAQVQEAIWYLRDNTWRTQDRAIAQEIVNNATSANVPPATGDGVSIVDAVAQNRVAVIARFTPQTADAFYGDGQVEIRNTGNSEIRLFMPIGVTFRVSSGGNYQDLTVYALSPSAQPTGTITGTATASPVATGTLTATVTAMATTTVTATVTGTVVASPTVTGTVVPTITPAITGTVTATVEVSPTVPATETPMATETPVIQETATPMPSPTVEILPTPTEVPGAGTLPQTGDGYATTLALMAIVAALALLCVGVGAHLARIRR
jgi:hypothetical protein